MYRTHNCGELRKSDINSEVVLCGWVQRIRNKGFLIWIDLRDRYGITQLFIDSEKTSPEVISIAKSLGREFVVSVTCLLYTSPSPRDLSTSRMPSSA